MPAAKMIRFHKSAQDGWLQKQLFLQCSFAAAHRRPNLSVRQGSVASHSQPLYRVRARLKPSLRSTLGNFGTRLTQTAPLERISPDKSALGEAIRACSWLTGYSEVVAQERVDEPGQKSASRRSLSISHKPVSGQLPSSRRSRSCRV